jgi:GTP-binding protein
MNNLNPDQQFPLVALLGRTNVGKSTIFNCLIEKRQALVSNLPGTTRDSNYGLVSWQNRDFELVDTAGILDPKHLGIKKITGDDIDTIAQRQARLTLDKADLIIFVVDNRDGLMKEDRDLAAILKKNTGLLKKTILVTNKVDSFKYAAEAAQFNKLGLGNPRLISAATGSGTGDLLDYVVERLAPLYKNEITPKENNDEILDDEDAEEQTAEADNKTDKEIRVCLVGKPNVGKSSLLNAILGYERVIVSAVAHTTREPQDTIIRYQDRKIRLVDTAGISKHGHKGKGLETFGIEKSLHALNKADIALLVIDLSEEITHQDAKIIQEITDRRKGMIIIANKWDKVEERNPKKWTETINHEFPFALWAPIHFVSAKTGDKVKKILDMVLAISAAREIKISDSQLQKFLNRIVKIHLPAKGKGLKAPHIYEFTQTDINPPEFIIRIGSKDNLHFSYVRFMENRLREKYGFFGTPIKMEVIKNRKVHGTAS